MTDHAGKLRAAADYLGSSYDDLDDELLAAADEIDRLRAALTRITSGDLVDSEIIDTALLALSQEPLS